MENSPRLDPSRLRVAAGGTRRRPRAPAALLDAYTAGTLRGVAAPALSAAARAVRAVHPDLSIGAALARVPAPALRLLAARQAEEMALVRPAVKALLAGTAVRPAQRALLTRGDLSFSQLLQLLPYDVAQALLNARAKAMREFFDSWAESLAENAKRDREAAERAHRTADAAKRVATARAQVGVHEAQHEAVRVQASRALAALDRHRGPLRLSGPRRAARLPAGQITTAPLRRALSAAPRGRPSALFARRAALELDPAAGPQPTRPRHLAGFQLRPRATLLR